MGRGGAIDMTTTSYEFLLVEHIGRVARITLNRPDRRNALSRGLQTELINAVEAAGSDPEVHAVIIRGAGKSFCSGYDVTPSGEAGHGAAAEISLPRRAVETVNMARGWSRIWNAPVAVIASTRDRASSSARSNTSAPPVNQVPLSPNDTALAFTVLAGIVVGADGRGPSRRAEASAARVNGLIRDAQRTAN